MKPRLAVVAAFVFLLPAAHAQQGEAVSEAAHGGEREGTVVDGTTNAPLAGAIVTVGR